MRRGGERHRLRAGSARLEALTAALVQNSDEVDQDVRGIAVAAQVPRPDGAHWPARRQIWQTRPRLQMPGKVRPAHRHADAVAALGKRAHHVAAEKPESGPRTR